MNFSLVPACQVPLLFTERIKSRSGHEKVFVTSMSADFENNPITENLAAYSNTQDVFMLDYFGHWHGVRPALFMRKQHRQARTQFQEEFKGTYSVIGPPPKINFTNSTIINRSHVKAYVVGNRVISLGGVNCVPYSYNDFVDLMLDFESDKFVSFLTKYYRSKGNLRQHGLGETLGIDRQNRIIIDYGRRNNFYGGGNRSLIMTSLLADLRRRDVSSVVMSSTCIPYGELDHILAGKVQRNIPVTFYANRPSKFSAPYSGKAELMLQRFYALKAKTPWTDNLKTRFNHLKAAIISYYSGEKIAYIGSHNFNQLHIWAGNTEASLRTADRRLITQLEDFISQNLA